MSKVVANESHAEALQDDCKGTSKGRSWGLLVTAGVGGTLVALYAVVIPFVIPALRRVCLPFVPATSTQIQNVLRMLENRSGSLVDIGSGDGRIVSRGHHFCCILALKEASDAVALADVVFSYL